MAIDAAIWQTAQARTRLSEAFLASACTNGLADLAFGNDELLDGLLCRPISLSHGLSDLSSILSWQIFWQDSAPSVSKHNEGSSLPVPSDLHAARRSSSKACTVLH